MWIVSVAEVTPVEKRVSEVLSLDALSSAEPSLCFLRRRKPDGGQRIQLKIKINAQTVLKNNTLLIDAIKYNAKQ